MKKIHGILKEEEKQRCNERKNEEGDSDNLRDEHQLRLHSPALVLAEESLCAARNRAGQVLRLAVLHQNGDNEEQCADEKNNTEYKFKSCHFIFPPIGCFSQCGLHFTIPQAKKQYIFEKYFRETFKQKVQKRFLFCIAIFPTMCYTNR